MKYIVVAVVLGLVTYGQLIIKQGVGQLGQAPLDNAANLVGYLLRAMTHWGILSGFLAAFLAALTWVVGLSHFELSDLYPLLALNFILVPLFSILLFGETFNAWKCAGVLITMAGLLVFSRGI